MQLPPKKEKPAEKPEEKIEEKPQGQKEAPQGQSSRAEQKNEAQRAECRK
ncbi:MAG: hypothetical protein ACLR78_13915 [Roseburia sp.]